MKTAQDVISVFQELPPKEKKIVVEFVISSQREKTSSPNYSPDDMEKIGHDIEEAEKGINAESFSSMAEARKSLGLT